MQRGYLIPASLRRALAGGKAANPDRPSANSKRTVQRGELAWFVQDFLNRTMRLVLVPLLMLATPQQLAVLVNF
jgi:hypothetical protein